MDKEFVPFGEEWEAEVMKLPKKVIIGLYRNVCLENNKNIPLDAEVKPACEWLEVDEEEGVTYETDCENKFVCGDYEELYKTFRYCIYCGGKIKVKKRKSV